MVAGKNKLTVLFLTRYPLEGASSRYRVYQYLPYLSECGIEYKVSSFMNLKMYRLTFSRGSPVKKYGFLIGAIFKRLFIVFRFFRFDIIYMQRELLPFGPPLLEYLLRLTGKKLVYDYDDALFINKTSQFNRLASFFKGKTRQFAIFKASHCVLAGNDYLRDVAKQFCLNSITFEVAEDTDRILPGKKSTNPDRIVIGWLGSKTTVKYLANIRDPLIRLHRSYPQIEFHIVGGDQRFYIDGLPIQHFEWSLEGELEALKAFDIGIMPLPIEEWSKGKSGGKARTYMAAGVVPVVTAIGYNLQLIQHKKTGFLCENDDDWFNFISHLVDNDDFRIRVGKNARKYVIEHFNVKKQSQKMAEILWDLKTNG